ncbi:Tetratricopeptide repeat protein [uncultured archaeon]|nr:Tetratricopeptide repeat protein [uncultured archaeon]
MLKVFKSHKPAAPEIQASHDHKKSFLQRLLPQKDNSISLPAGFGLGFGLTVIGWGLFMTSCGTTLPPHIEYRRPDSTTVRRAELSNKLETYNFKIAQYPDSAALYMNRGDVLYELFRYSNALDDFYKASQLDLTLAKAYSARARVLRVFGRYSEALALNDKALGLDSSSSYIYSSHSRSLIDFKRFSEALDDCDKAVALEPNSTPARYYRALALLALERYPEALEDCDKAVSLDSNSFMAHNIRGVVLAGLKLYSEAIEEQNQAIRLAPDYAFAYSDRGWCLLDLGYSLLAIDDFTKSIDLAPSGTNSCDIYAGRGFAYNRTGNYQNASSDYALAIQSDPLNSKEFSSGLHVNRGFALANLWRYSGAHSYYSEAISEYERALSIDPSNETAKSNLENLKSYYNYLQKRSR